MLLNVELQIAKPQLIKANNKTLLKNELHCMCLHEFSDISENSNSLETIAKLGQHIHLTRSYLQPLAKMIPRTQHNQLVIYPYHIIYAPNNPY